MRRFGRRFGRTRRFAGTRRRARRLGAYEILFEDIERGTVDGSEPPRVDLTFATGPGGVISAGSVGTEEESALPQQTTSTQAVRVRGEGFTTVIPLWDVSLDAKWQQDCSLQSLRGYVRPIAVDFQDSTSGLHQGLILKVRLAIVMASVSVLEAGFGDVSAIFPTTIWSRSGQQQRILWQRDWYVVNNPASGRDNQYWNQGGLVAGSVSTGNEPRLAVNNGGDLVRLKRCGRIVRGRWPLLFVGVKGMPILPGPGGTVDIAANGTVTLQETVDLSVSLQGSLRAWIQR